LIELPEGISETQAENPRQSFAFRCAAQNFLVPGFRIVDVTIVRSDIEISQDDNVFELRQLFLDPGGYLVKPVQLVIEFFRTHFAAIDHVQINDANIANGHGARAGGRNSGRIIAASGMFPA